MYSWSRDSISLLPSSKSSALTYLHVHERRPAVFPSDVVHLSELPRKHRRGAQIANLAGSYDVVKGLQRLVDRCFRIETMDQEYIDLVSAHSAQARLHGGQKVLSGKASIIGVVAHRVIGLGGQYQAIPGNH